MDHKLIKVGPHYICLGHVTHSCVGTDGSLTIHTVNGSNVVLTGSDAQLVTDLLDCDAVDLAEEAADKAEALAAKKADVPKTISKA